MFSESKWPEVVCLVTFLAFVAYMASIGREDIVAAIMSLAVSVFILSKVI